MPAHGWRQAPPREPSVWPRCRRLSVLLSCLAVVLITAMVACALFFIFARLPASARPATYAVRYGRLQPVVVVRGDVEPVQCSEIVCQVKARSQGSLSSTTLRWIIEDGARVRKGQLVAELDDSDLEEELHARRILLAQAENAWRQSEENYKIIVSQNESAIQAAATALQLADLDLEKYVNGDYEQLRKDLEGRIRLAEAGFDQWHDRAAWARNMSRRGYLSANQLHSEQSQLRSAALGLERVQEEYRVLRQFGRKRTLVELESKLSEARLNVELVKGRSKVKEIQAEVDRLSKKRIQQRQRQRCRDIELQINKCFLVAPQDGMVQYHYSDSSRFGSRAVQSIVDQGEPVREGQVLMRIPDLSRMQVRTQIHEALAGYVHGDVWEPTCFGDSLGAALLASPDPLSRLASQYAFSHLRKHFQTHEQRQTQHGELARIRLDAFPERVFQGHVTQVGNFPRHQEVGSGLLPVYQTYVALDEPVEGLLPNMSAEVTILMENIPEHVLTVPVKALVHSPDQGKLCTCLVQTPQGPEEREVLVGRHTEELAEVLSGLEEGEEVLLSPRQHGEP